MTTLTRVCKIVRRKRYKIKSGRIYGEIFAQSAVPVVSEWSITDFIIVDFDKFGSLLRTI